MSRTYGLAAVSAFIVSFAASLAWSNPAAAQAQNLEAGKTPSQIFSSTCSLCHKSSRGMLKTVPPGSLPGFLRQHYTTSTDMASAMSAFVISNGAADARAGGGGLTQQGIESRSAQKPAATPAAEPERQERRVREANKPNNEGAPSQPREPPAEAKPKSAKGAPPKNEQKSAALKDEPVAAEDRPKDQSRPDAALKQASRSDQPQTPAEPPVLTIDTSPAPPSLDGDPSRTPAGPPVPPISQ